jgi:serine/threonine protein kinase
LIGRQLGAYRVVSLLGAGGMGEVYRARDTTLGRDVALKVLPAIFTADRDRLARFEREARTLATLNHPHIGAIYGLEEHDNIRVLVLEIVEGSTLATRLAKRPLPLMEALDIARQIAEALEAAHEKGIVHRDLKPANISVTSDGIAKVLDFGLAKVLPAEGSALDVTETWAMTSEGTMEGMIVGTAPYMSPEQARGKAVDKRSDIWSFGCVLYEMLAGRRAFPGETLSDTVAAILEREPVWSALPEKTPPGIRQLLHRCLEKDPKARLRDIGEARIELAAQPHVPALPAPRPSAKRPLLLALAALVVVICAMALYVSLIKGRNPQRAAVPSAAPAGAMSPSRASETTNGSSVPSPDPRVPEKVTPSPPATASPVPADATPPGEPRVRRVPASAPDTTGKGAPPRSRSADVAGRCSQLNERAGLGEALTQAERDFLAQQCRNEG